MHEILKRHIAQSTSTTEDNGGLGFDMEVQEARLTYNGLYIGKFKMQCVKSACDRYWYHFRLLKLDRNGKKQSKS